jgi:Ca2+-binding RTX toxin-like protein
MTTLTITTSTDYRSAPNNTLVNGQNRTALTFSGTNAVVEAAFLATQFSGGNISNTVTITGRNGRNDTILVFFGTTPGALNASSWLFSNWASDDVVAIVGSAGTDNILGSSVADNIAPGDGVDTVQAGGGDDVILISDTVSAPEAGESFNGGDGQDTLRLTYDGSKNVAGITLLNVETIDLGSSSGDLSLVAQQVGTAPGGVRTIIGNASTDLSITATAAFREVDMRFLAVTGITKATINGTPGADVLPEAISGGAGDDLIIGSRAAEGGLGVGGGVINRAAGTANGSVASAITIGGVWSKLDNANIAASTGMPHISTASAADALNIRHYYRIDMVERQVVLLDIDASVGFDPVMRVLDANGAVLRASDDSPLSLGGGGSSTTVDPFLAFRAPTAGTYYVEIGAYGIGPVFNPQVNPVPAGATYTLHTSTAISGLGGDDTLQGGDGADILTGGSSELVGGAGPDVLVGGEGFTRFVITAPSDLAGDIIDSGKFFASGALELPTGIVQASWTNTMIREIGEIRLSPGFTQMPARFFRDGGFGETLRFDTQGYSLFTQYYPQFFLDDATPFIDASGFRFNASSQPLAWEFSGSRFEFLSNGNSGKTVTATAFRDYIWLGNGADSVRAGDGNDLVGAAAGDDTIFGEAGNDFLYGDSFDVNATGRDLIWGGDGNDIIEGYGGNDTLLGENGDDELDGGLGADIMYGWFGNDSLAGSLGDDTMFGEQGNDRLFGDEGADVLWGGDGDDDMDGYFGNDVLLGEAGNDTLAGYDGADLIYGWTGADSISGGDGNDTLFGEQDNDTIDGGFRNDLIWGGDGNDLLDGGFGEGGNGRDTLLGEAGDDTMFGQQDDDVLYGWVGADVLWGEQGADSLFGEDGDDTFIGGLGRDTMTGGQGADRFFNANVEIAAGEVDLITDYDAADRYLFQTGAQIQYFDFNAPGYGAGAGIHVQTPGGVYILDVFGANAAQLQAQTQFF